MINNHKELVWCAARLLSRWRCSPVLTELVTCNQTGEVPDAIGWTSWCSILMECKVSRRDFLKDKQKVFRCQMPDQGMGNWRFYFVTSNVAVSPEDMLPGWGAYRITKAGLIEHVCGVKFSSNAIPPFQSVNTRAELQMLRSKCRRLYAALR